MSAEFLEKTRSDRSKAYACRFSCGFETTWPAALGRHEAARHSGHVGSQAAVAVTPGQGNGKPAAKSQQVRGGAKWDRLLDGLRTQHEEILQALKKAALLALAKRDLRAREAEQITADLGAIYEVLERNRHARRID